MSDRNALLRALIHDLRSPLNVMQAALPEIEAPPDDRYVGLARKSTDRCVFALAFVQRALDRLHVGGSSAGPVSTMRAAELRADVDALLAGAPPAEARVAVAGPADLANGSIPWALVAASLRLLVKDEALTCEIESDDVVAIVRETSWAALVEDASRGFGAQRPGFAAWTLEAALRAGGLGLTSAEDARIRVKKSAS